MKPSRFSAALALVLVVSGFCVRSSEASVTNNFESAIAIQAEALEVTVSDVTDSTVIDLTDLTTNPTNYDFFTFRPNLEKLILAGEADTEHISILWYTVPDGQVGLHYHAMTESVYTIEGTQTDAKGTYPTGSLYFNPPGSGHQILDSSGFFILAYAAPPDFANTDNIEDYTPVQINTADPNLEEIYPFTEVQDSVQRRDIPLDREGGMNALFIKSTSLESYQYVGNYLLVLSGSCNINGTAYSEKMLVVSSTVEPQTYQVSTTEGSSCLFIGLSF